MKAVEQSKLIISFVRFQHQQAGMKHTETVSSNLFNQCVMNSSGTI